MTGPTHPYLVCATQRSGSTLLCSMLEATGVAGHPLEHFEVRRETGRPPQPREYFEGLEDDDALALLAPTPAPDPVDEPAPAWWARVLAAGSTPNGVWGGKLMANQVDDLTQWVRELLDDPGATLKQGIDELLGATHFVFVTRGDRVDQAVSLWKAAQTQRWRADAEGTRHEPVYHFAAISHLIGWLEECDSSWREWFATNEIEPLHVVYEELSADPSGVVAATVDHLELSGVEIGAPPLRRQGDETSRLWSQRYRSEAGVTA